VVDPELSNNFGYMNSLKFKFKLKLKFREAKVVLNFRDLIKILRSFRNL
jgi:hypothetical protein